MNQQLFYKANPLWWATSWWTHLGFHRSSIHGLSDGKWKWDALKGHACFSLLFPSLACRFSLVKDPTILIQKLLLSVEACECGIFCMGTQPTSWLYVKLVLIKTILILGKASFTCVIIVKAIDDSMLCCLGFRGIFWDKKIALDLCCYTARINKGASILWSINLSRCMLCSHSLHL